MKIVRKIQKKLVRARAKLERQEKKLSAAREAISILEGDLLKEFDAFVKTAQVVRRGRPRKTPVAPAVSSSVNAEGAPRRGRPRKTQPVETPVAVAKSPAKAAGKKAAAKRIAKSPAKKGVAPKSAPKGQRGRPRKSR